jgi:predicted DNA binding CopG/RHH family protein
MAKKVKFGVKLIEQKSASVDEWVDTRSTSGEIADSTEPTPAPKEKFKRLTLDIPETLHRAIKGKAASEGLAMVDMLRELLEKKYGNL